MATFANTTNPTAFGFFDEDTGFQTEADNMITFVKRKLGDDILSVELTKKQIWSCFEESMLEYGAIINQAQAKSQLGNLMGFAPGSAISGSTNVGPHGSEQKLPRETLEFLERLAEPYAMTADVGGSFNSVSGSIDLVKDKQDYDLYNDLKNDDGTALFLSGANDPKTKMKIQEVLYFDPQAAYRFFDTTSAINYLNNEFSFESFTPETVFYVLPVFEDVLRGGMLDLSTRVRRSNYSYRINGTNIRIYPVPTKADPGKLWIRAQYSPDPFNPSYADSSIFGVSNLSNVPYGNLQFSRINSVGRQWIRQYTLSLSKQLLGLIRSKFSSVPIPGGDLNLNGADLISQATTELENLKEQLRTILDELTYSKIMEAQATDAENIRKVLSHIPIPLGKAIIIG